MTQLTTSRAGIIINFYGRRDSMKPLQKNIGLALNLPRAQGNHEQKDMSDQSQGITLYLTDPPNAPDTSIIHLAVGDPELEPADDAPTMWEKWLTTFREADFQLILDEEVLRENEVFWGYSLIFHAACDPTSYQNHPPEALLKLARRPDMPPWLEPEPLADGTLHGSHLWLMDTPNEMHGSLAATVYMALMPPDKEPTMLTDLYHGRSALLLGPDLIAHKSYYQGRQFIDVSADIPPRDLYKSQILAMPELVGPLLGLSSASQTTPVPNQAQQLRGLNQAYSLLLYTTSLLNEPHLSLALQKKHYERWQEQFGQNEVYQYHYRQISQWYAELGLLLDKGQAMLDASRTTTEMIQTNLSQAEAQREKITQAILAVVGVAFACPQLIDPNAAQAIINLFMGSPSPDDIARLIALAMQLFLILLMGLIIGLMIRIRN